MSLMEWFDEPKEETWLDWHCKTHIWSCYLYEELGDPVLTDDVYDWTCRLLLKHYDKCPAWYHDVVSIGDLKAGTGSVIVSKLSDDQIAEAKWWRYDYIPKLRAKYPGGKSCNGYTKVKK